MNDTITSPSADTATTTTTAGAAPLRESSGAGSAATRTTDPVELDAERRELLGTLAAHRDFLRTTVRGLSDEQARTKPTASELCLAAILKHVASQESQWIDFVVEGTSAIPDFDPATTFDLWADEFRPADDETLEVLLARYDAVAERTEAVVAGVADLSDAHPLPVAPWFEPGATWSARRVVLHLIAETAQHAGHADIIRESIDGAKTMG